MLGAVPAFTDARVQQSCGLMLEASVQVYLSGMFAGAVQAGITTPSDLLKIRMQLQPQPGCRCLATKHTMMQKEY